jgi:RNA polymerase-binding transcription factor DksA
MVQELDLKHFQEKLAAGAAALEKDLEKIARHNPKNLADWEIKPADAAEEDTEFRDEVAGQLEAFDKRLEIEINLEKQLRNIKHALAKIPDGQYGRCEVCGQMIEIERLETNPAAQTCKKHLEASGLS